MTALEVGNLSGLVAIFVAIMVGPPILMTIIGFAVKKNSPNGAKVCFIIGALYLIVGLGICGTLLS
ncbi:hypothetical protein [Flavobacterium tyrosinilyticum]|uniref:hypothetical protein n=1 Tax=Flavobacterium tyrosinilyticum TaxID=1658740 RepID=UPI0020301034|nr:hypothetical protein [Flavobacterium tyrosinilyticum]MCM0665676.1 hypothetical protein [Flavobacterium tyrosinilyticum]